MDQLKCHLCGELEHPSVISQCCNQPFCSKHQISRCPGCDAPFATMYNFLVEAFYSQSLLCQCCEEVESSLVCSTCSTVLCVDCSEQIHSRGVYKRHDVKSCIFRSQADTNRCQAHNDGIRYICTEDWKSGCAECMEEHKEHPVLSIEDAVNDTVGELTRKVEALTSHRHKLEVEMTKIEAHIEETRYSSSRAKEQVEKKIQYQQAMLAIQREELLKEIDLSTNTSLQQATIRKNQLNENISNIDSIRTLIDLAVRLPGSSLLNNLNFLSSILENHTLKDPTPLVESDFTQYQWENKTKSAEDEASQPRKFTMKLTGSSSIKLAWTHCNTHAYLLEYGIGSKVNGVEQFRQVYKGQAYNCIITDLLPKTTYRFRVAAMVTETEASPWSEPYSVTTNELQSIDESSFKNNASFIKRGNERWLQLDKAALIMAKYPYSFGKHVWEVKIVCNNIFATDDQTGSMKVGVCNAKTKNLIGLECLYYSVKRSYKIRVELDIDALEMVIFHEDRAEPEVFTLSEGHFVPALHHKPAKNQRTQVKALVVFND